MHRVEMHACCHGMNFLHAYCHMGRWNVGTCSTWMWRHVQEKINVDPAQSDKKVFSRMPMGDTWDDAESAIYFYNSSGTKIPDSWYS